MYYKSYNQVQQTIDIYSNLSFQHFINSFLYKSFDKYINSNTFIYQ